MTCNKVNANEFHPIPFEQILNGTACNLNDPAFQATQSIFRDAARLSSPYCSAPDLDFTFNIPCTGYGYGGYAGIDSLMFGGGYFPGVVGGVGAATSPADYMNRMKEYQREYTDFMVERQKQNRNAELRINGSVDGVEGAVSTLRDKILRDEQDQIPAAFDNLMEKVKEVYGESSEGDIRSRAIKTYKNLTGVNLIDDIRANGSGSFKQGLVQTICFGLNDNHSAEDTVSYINKAPVASAEKTHQNIGRLTGCGVIGGTVGTVTKMLTKGKHGGKAGLIAAGLTAAITFLTGRITT